MSAIAGIYHLDNEPVLAEHGRTMMRELEKYPADAIRTWNSGAVFLGCHVQHITPEAVYEQLPYYDADRQIVIAADAILDNRPELVRLLEVDYERRRKITDSELILLAYERWGQEAPQHLIGDFAFMLWDAKARQLFGARDFSGSRTLYYCRSGMRFAFCTVIGPLLSLPRMKAELNESWLAEYLAISGMIDVVDTAATVYKDIEQLPPAHSITVTSSGARLSRYCTLTPGKPLRLKSDGEYVEAFQAVFGEAVTSRLRTHRQVGAQLSGGLDSGSIAGFAAGALRKENKPLHTFSYVPSGDFHDYTSKRYMANERPFIEATVRHVGNIRDHYLDFEGRNSFLEVEDFLDLMEMPYKFFENSFWLKGIFEKARDEQVGVLLNGGRGNLSISWGSANEYYAILLKRLKWVKLFKELDQYSTKTGGSRYRRLPLIARTAFPFIDRMVPQADAYPFPPLIHPEFARRTGVFKKLQRFDIDESGWYGGIDAYEMRKRHFEELFHWNASNTLAAKLSLRYGLWKRDPTNDLRVIRFCLSVPEEQYVQGGMDRALIRRATENVLPDQVRLNQKVRGVQGADWVHRMIPHWNAFREELHRLCADERMRQILNVPAIEKALHKLREGVRPEHAIDPDYKVLMRSLIVYRFISRLT
ncbi:Asparagine synthetase [glutamine-hydrolyzing] 3 [Paenibacillus konkukensis]|uniref:asparagine synthase (glutamine-hydrolyzing) n=1 Tax=Paenibacillus konkukensis TaxID=2020716 RepID=A0ABY4RWD7_9BACL|nr:lasso peptide isopeptide bond-forming cyclase [Paenibacillus konkukensis]UQZ85679.1 Asparagine synthetase [glutamine-hydrolyzing] 3 [Paenibacillus konkukensis]